jgi:hypothetical protein
MVLSDRNGFCRDITSIRQDGRTNPSLLSAVVPLCWSGEEQSQAAPHAGSFVPLSAAPEAVQQLFTRHTGLGSRWC